MELKKKLLEDKSRSARRSSDTDAAPLVQRSKESPVQSTKPSNARPSAAAEARPEARQTAKTKARCAHKFHSDKRPEIISTTTQSSHGKRNTTAGNQCILQLALSICIRNTNCLADKPWLKVSFTDLL